MQVQASPYRFMRRVGTRAPMVCSLLLPCLTAAFSSAKALSKWPHLRIFPPYIKTFLSKSASS
jgi:hypothetical protein